MILDAKDIYLPTFYYFYKRIYKSRIFNFTKIYKNYVSSVSGNL